LTFIILRNRGASNSNPDEVVGRGTKAGSVAEIASPVDQSGAEKPRKSELGSMPATGQGNVPAKVSEENEPKRNDGAQNSLFHLFNGKDLSTFEIAKLPFLASEPGNPEDTFAVRDHTIQIYGETRAQLMAKEDFQDYRLIISYKWGTRLWRSRAQGLEGFWLSLHRGDNSARPLEGFYVLLTRDSERRFFHVTGRTKITSHATGNHFNPEGPEIALVGPEIALHKAPKPQAHGVHLRKTFPDVEKLLGEWNTLECVCDGSSIDILINNTLVLQASSASRTKGRIGFVSGSAEVFIREVSIQPLR